MATQTTPITPQNFWTHDYIRRLVSRDAKLIFAYLVFTEREDPHVFITEDVALHTGLDQSICRSWVHQFMAQGALDKVEIL